MNKKSCYPNTLHSILLTLSVLLVQLLLSIILFIVSGPDILKNTVVILGAAFISFIGAELIGCRIAKTSIRKLFIKPGFTKNKAPYLCLLIIGCWCILACLVTIFTNVSSLAQQTQEQISDILVGDSNIWIGAAYTILIAPIIEEIFFRGIILQGLLKNYSIKKAVILSSALFAFIHFNIVQTPAAFFQGIVLAVIYIKTGSLALSILGHIVNNALGIFASGLLLGNGIYFIAAIGVILTAVSIYKIRKMPNNINHLLDNEEMTLQIHM